MLAQVWVLALFPPFVSSHKGLVMKAQVHEEPRIAAAVERQMQTWVRLQEAQDRTVLSGPHQRPATNVSYVTISREAGAGGSDIGRALGQRLNWEVLDKNLLDRVAEQFHEPRRMLDLVDETPSNWVYDVLGTWMDRSIVTHERYVAQLSRVLLAATRQGRFVLVGRGAQFLLPRDKVLAVRIVAPESYRIEQVMQRQGVSRPDARRIVRDTDLGRQQFVQRFFHRDIGDAHLYDLVINAERVGPTRTVELILAAAGR
jgi:hypothetical protein